MASSPTSSTFVVLVSGTSHTREATVTKTSYDVYVDPCATLTTDLASQVKIDMGVPPSSALTCSFLSVSILSSGRRLYSWYVTAAWND